MLPLPAPSSQNLSSSEAFKLVVGAVKASGAASFNNANGLPEKQAHWKFRLPTPHSADAVEMLVRQMGGLSSPLKLTLSRIAPEHAVILNVQPAAKCPQLGLTWDSLTHGRAAAFGSPSLLRWLLGPPNLPLQKPGSPKTAGWFEGDSRALTCQATAPWQVIVVTPHSTGAGSELQRGALQSIGSSAGTGNYLQAHTRWQQSVFDALQYLEIARMGDLDLLELMAPIMRCNCDMLYVLKNMISASAGWVDGPLPLMPEKSRKKYWGIRRPSPRVLEVFDWLAGAQQSAGRSVAGEEFASKGRRTSSCQLDALGLVHFVMTGGEAEALPERAADGSCLPLLGIC
ncbi:hypothetical protein WJX84_009085 [Apatococcus fuscideae]|uniref:Uncharacterized protein n=1 Tax=Apatococcus fuscideae TaxID=2026836 RepID=A0AAW1SRX5_9CHLO